MPKSLPLEDFRAVRIVLENDDFAIVPEDPDRPARDLIDRDTWNSIVTLPDDVSIRNVQRLRPRAARNGSLLGRTHRLSLSAP